MKQSIKSTLTTNQIERFIEILKKGYSLQETLKLLYLIEPNEACLYFQKQLEKGIEIHEVFSYLHKDQQFNEMFEYLMPIKGLVNALEDALCYFKKKTEWSNLLKKQLLYPMFLIFIMLMFSLFVKMKLIPEMEILYQSFQMDFKQNYNLVIIYLIPNLLLVICLSFSFLGLLIGFDLKTNNKRRIIWYLKIPVLNKWIKTYYSIKFSFYFSKFTDYFQSFYETMDYFYKITRHTDLKVVLDDIYFKLKNGFDLQTIIQESIYFTDIFKSFFYMILVSKQKFTQLEDYSDVTFREISLVLKRLTNLLLAIIYLFTGLYIMSLYSLMIIPVLEITSYF